MNKVWKWVLGIGAGVLALAGLAGLFVMGRWVGYAVRMGDMSSRMSRFDMLDGRRVMTASFDHFSPFGFMGFGLGALLWLAVLALAAWGAYSLIRNARRIPQPVAAAPMAAAAPVMGESAASAVPERTCSACGKPAAADWNTCPYCGQPLAGSDPEI